jgi:2,3-bisphosphoglycerate-independent phosphoglycerate mutase
MRTEDQKITRPVALVILDGWGYAPRTDGNAIAIAHTPNYDEICRRFPMTVLSAAGERDGETDVAGNAEVGHLRIGTGRAAMTESSRIRRAIASGEFMENVTLNGAFQRAAISDSSVHLIGLVSDGGVHSSTETLFALLRLAKRSGLKDVYIHCILDGLDVAPRTADVCLEALEVKIADIGVGRIATLCGRFFAMDSSEQWERTARAYTMLVHAEGERARDPVSAIRTSFLRGISDEFISPIILEREPGVAVTTLKDGDLAVFFNHRADGMRQFVRSVSLPDTSAAAKPVLETVCLTDYDPAFDLPTAFAATQEKNTLTSVLSDVAVANYKITESARVHHLTEYFDGRGDNKAPSDREIFVRSSKDGSRYGQPESESFKITDKFLRVLEASNGGVFIVNMPAADLMAESGDMTKTVAAIQYIDTCLGGICDAMRDRDGVVMITSTHGNCEDMIDRDSGKHSNSPTYNPVPFHYLDARMSDATLRETGSLEDVAPTILGVLGVEKPPEMTGSELRML